MGDAPENDSESVLLPKWIALDGGLGGLKFDD